jgi:single-strand DNA-binding protein
MSENTVTIVGNVVRSPELKFLNNGQASLRMSVAVNRTWTNKQTQEREDRVSYLEVSAYGSMAENVANSVDKGTRVVVTGRLEQRSWETAEGDKRSIIEINSDEIAVSLKWATTVITKVAKPEGGSSSRTSGPRPAPAIYAFDDEPF